MDIHIFNKLPKDIIYIISSYDNRFKWRNGKCIIQIPKNDDRYILLHKINRQIRQIYLNKQISHIVLGSKIHLTIFWGDYATNNRVINYYYRSVNHKYNSIYNLH